jgi:dTDP-4-dehydrorhamnose reductase
MHVLITGAGGQLGRDLIAALGERPGRTAVVATNRSQLDVADRDAVLQAMTTTRPSWVDHAAAWTAVDACEDDPDRAFRVNALGTRHVAEGAALVDAHLVYVSTDYVFDGAATGGYREWDPTNPVSVYGRSKLGGEREVQTLRPDATIVRTSWLCGAHGANMAKTVLRLADQSPTLRFVDDQRGCPTFTEDLAPMILRLGGARLPGVFHVTNQGETTWYQFARDVLTAAGRDAGRVEPIATADLVPPRAARRPANSVLDNAAVRYLGLPLLDDHHVPLERLVKALTS